MERPGPWTPRAWARCWSARRRRAEDLRAGDASFGSRVWNGYGQAESPNSLTAMPAADVAASLDRPDRLTSVGTARFATRVRVVDGAGRPLPPGEVGEVVVSGPTVMAGYLNRPEATGGALRDGWLHTGDLGRFDDGAYLTGAHPRACGGCDARRGAGAPGLPALGTRGASGPRTAGPHPHALRAGGYRRVDVELRRD